MRFAYASMRGEILKKITFNSLYEIPEPDEREKVAEKEFLSILFMRFKARYSWQKKLQKNFFQFSLWDSALWKLMALKK